MKNGHHEPDDRLGDPAPFTTSRADDAHRHLAEERAATELLTEFQQWQMNNAALAYDRIARDPSSTPEQIESARWNARYQRDTLSAVRHDAKDRIAAAERGLVLSLGSVDDTSSFSR